MGLFCTLMENRAKIQLSVARNGPTLTDSQRALLLLSFTREEIKEAMWSIPDDKARGLDGFNSRIYKASWDVVGEDVVRAIALFFDNGRMPRSWNITPITLIPKVSCSAHPGDFRPISCCHVVYKCISKLICSRLQRVLGGLVDQAQGAFVPGRSIMHNILLY